MLKTQHGRKLKFGDLIIAKQSGVKFTVKILYDSTQQKLHVWMVKMSQQIDQENL